MSICCFRRSQIFCLDIVYTIMPAIKYRRLIYLVQAFFNHLNVSNWFFCFLLCSFPGQNKASHLINTVPIFLQCYHMKEVLRINQCIHIDRIRATRLSGASCIVSLQVLHAIIVFCKQQSFVDLLRPLQYVYSDCR